MEGWMIFEDPFSNETLQKVIIRSYSTLHGPYCPIHRYSFFKSTGSSGRGMPCHVDFSYWFHRNYPSSYSRRTVCQLLPKGIRTYCERTVYQKASSLLLKHSYGILAHIFLSNQATTTKVLNFVIKVLTDATSSFIDIFLILWDWIHWMYTYLSSGIWHALSCRPYPMVRYVLWSR